MAAREHWKRFGYDAEKEFEAVRRTEKAVLLRCAVELPDGGTEAAEFWLPRAVTGNWEFVARKIKEIEAGFPFNGMRVVRRPPRAGRAASPGAGGKL
jgi:hypothetical protein